MTTVIKKASMDINHAIISRTGKPHFMTKRLGYDYLILNPDTLEEPIKFNHEQAVGIVKTLPEELLKQIDPRTIKALYEFHSRIGSYDIKEEK